MRLFIKKKTIVILMGLFFLNACGSIKEYRKMEQPIDSNLTTSIGGTIFRLNKSSNLPNVFGKADVWGGKVDKGYSELRLAAINEGVLTLEVIESNKSSTETVMDRYKPLQRNSLANINVKQEISLGSSDESHNYKFEFDPKKQKDIVISGIKVTFQNVQPYSVEYALEDTQR